MRICEGCDCTDERACFDPATGQPCFWMEGYDGDLCSVCAGHLLAMEAGGYLQPEPGAGSFVEIFSDADADRFIRERRTEG